MENKKMNENQLNQVVGGRPVTLDVNAEDHNIFLTKVEGDEENVRTPGENAAFTPIADPAASVKPEPEEAHKVR